MSVHEPPPPQRGRTADERTTDATPDEQKYAESQSMTKRLLLAAKPSFLLAQAGGYPVGIKQFLQFCLILIYPAWLFCILVGGVFYGVLWIIFSPLRMIMKRKDPEAYAASQRK
jgi:hypothetical protein